MDIVSQNESNKSVTRRHTKRISFYIHFAPIEAQSAYTVAVCRQPSYVMFFFNHGYNRRVYPTAHKPDIPITCDLARVKAKGLLLHM